jgi:virulence-associated protein VapD
MVSPSTIIPSIQILALEVYFKVRNELKTLPSFLKCFRNVEMFHVKVSVSNFFFYLTFCIAGPLTYKHDH